MQHARKVLLIALLCSAYTSSTFLLPILLKKKISLLQLLQGPQIQSSYKPALPTTVVHSPIFQPPLPLAPAVQRRIPEEIVPSYVPEVNPDLISITEIQSAPQIVESAAQSEANVEYVSDVVANTDDEYVSSVEPVSEVEYIPEIEPAPEVILVENLPEVTNIDDKSSVLSNERDTSPIIEVADPALDESDSNEIIMNLRVNYEPDNIAEIQAEPVGQNVSDVEMEELSKTEDIPEIVPLPLSNLPDDFPPAVAIPTPVIDSIPKVIPPVPPQISFNPQHPFSISHPPIPYPSQQVNVFYISGPSAPAVLPPYIPPSHPIVNVYTIPHPPQPPPISVPSPPLSFQPSQPIVNYFTVPQPPIQVTAPPPTPPSSPVNHFHNFILKLQPEPQPEEPVINEDYVLVEECDHQNEPLYHEIVEVFPEAEIVTGDDQLQVIEAKPVKEPVVTEPYVPEIDIRNFKLTGVEEPKIIETKVPKAIKEVARDQIVAEELKFVPETTPKPVTVQPIITTPKPVVVPRSTTSEPIVVSITTTPEPVVVSITTTPGPVVVPKSTTPEPVVVSIITTPEPVVVPKSTTSEPIVEHKTTTHIQPVEVVEEVSNVQPVPIVKNSISEEEEAAGPAKRKEFFNRIFNFPLKINCPNLCPKKED